MIIGEIHFISGAVTLITEVQAPPVADTQAMTQDLEQFMQQTQESMLMSAAEQNLVTEKSEGEAVPVAVQQSESAPEPVQAPGLNISIVACPETCYFTSFKKVEIVQYLLTFRYLISKLELNFPQNLIILFCDIFCIFCYYFEIECFC